MNQDISSHGDKALQFFGLRRFPFHSTSLKPPYDDLFLNRQTEAETIKAAVLRGKNSAIVGAQGTGKSSLLYRVFMQSSPAVFGKVLEFALSGDTETNRRQFLQSVYLNLLNVLKEQPLLAKKAKIDVSLELQRLAASVTLERLTRAGKKEGAETSAEIGGGVLQELLGLIPKAGGTIQRERSTEEERTERWEWPIHNENTLTDGISRICDSLDRRVALFIDELDKAGRPPLAFEGWDNELTRILELSRELMVQQQLTFVFTLQEEILEQLRAATAGHGDASLLGLIPEHVALGPFDLTFAQEYLRHALAQAGWEKPVEEFCDPVLIKVVWGLTAGNPRRFSNSLERMTSRAAILEVKPITTDVLWEVQKDSFEQGLGLTRRHWDVVVAVAKSEVGLPKGNSPYEKSCGALVRKKILAQKRGRYVFR